MTVEQFRAKITQPQLMTVEQLREKTGSGQHSLQTENGTYTHPTKTETQKQTANVNLDYDYLSDIDKFNLTKSTVETNKALQQYKVDTSRNESTIEPINDISKGLSNIGEIKEYFPEELTFGTTRDGESMIMMKGFRNDGGKMSFFHVDAPHTKDGKVIGHHLNTVNQKQRNMINLTPLQEKVLTKRDHFEIPKPVYDTFKNFDDVAETVKFAGKAAAVVGALYDTYEFGKTVYDDLNDGDGKLGRDTDEMVFGINGGWAGGAIGTKLGTISGAAIGTAICPGLGTVIGGFIGGSAGGIIGATKGRELGESVVNQIYQEKKYVP